MVSLSELFLAICGHPIEFRYRESTSEMQPLEESSGQGISEEPKRILEGIPSDKTFDNFVVGKCNEFAHAAAMAVADSLGEMSSTILYTCMVPLVLAKRI